MYTEKNDVDESRCELLAAALNVNFVGKGYDEKLTLIRFNTIQIGNDDYSLYKVGQWRNWRIVINIEYFDLAVSFLLRERD